MLALRFAAAAAATAAGLVLGTACTDTFGLPNARFDNVLDTVGLSALDGTPIGVSAGYDLASGSPVRTDRSGAFDFAFNLDGQGQALLVPSNAVGLGGNAGLLVSTTSFDSLRFAPGEGYNVDSASAVTVGTVVVVRSRLSNCEFANLFYYGKLRILTIDVTARRVTFEILANINCGYRSLDPGRPVR
jgi:hypothetical protein